MKFSVEQIDEFLRNEVEEYVEIWKKEMYMNLIQMLSKREKI